jgi:hypothetical protein
MTTRRIMSSDEFAEALGMTRNYLHVLRHGHPDFPEPHDRFGGSLQWSQRNLRDAQAWLEEYRANRWQRS